MSFLERLVFRKADIEATEVLEAEMEAHLGYKKHSDEVDGSGNSHNGGYSEKTVVAGDGEAQIQVPRDCNDTFEPEIVKKYERRLPLSND